MRLILLTTLALLAGGLSAYAEPTKHGVPETRPIQLDGQVVQAEWSAALALSVAEGSELLLQQFRGTLMLALRSDRAWTTGSSITLWLCPDGPQAGARGPGAVRIDYEPYEHNRAHVFFYRQGKRVYDNVVVRHGIRAGRSSLEMAVPLRELGFTQDKRPALRLCFQWSRPGGPSFLWPQHINLRATAGRMPPDLATAARWGLLSGWGDPTAPGAFSKSDWTAWIERDRTIRRRGAEAHGAIHLLVEEWKKTKKRDKELVPQVLGNLAAIRKHERLTGNDQLAMATALRYLNYHDRAQGLIESLLDHPNPAIPPRAYRERALLFESMQRYEEAAQDWEHLAATTVKAYSAWYTRAATAAREKAEGWAAEAKARAAAEKNAKLPRVALHTKHGVIEILLHAEDVPDAAKHFLELVSTKFYDGTLFHRVHGDFLAQGGDPKSRDEGLEKAGRGSSPQMIAVEENTRHTFWRGAVGFARGISDYNGSQFFLMTGPRPKLGDYTCFGHIVRGQHAADRLEYGDALIKAVVLKP